MAEPNIHLHVRTLIICSIVGSCFHLILLFVWKARVEPRRYRFFHRFHWEKICNFGNPILPRNYKFQCPGITNFIPYIPLFSFSRTFYKSTSKLFILIISYKLKQQKHYTFGLLIPNTVSFFQVAVVLYLPLISDLLKLTLT